MQRFAPLWLCLTAVLYGAPLALASTPPATEPAAAPASAALALLLPTRAKQAQLALAAEAIKNGAYAAEKNDGGLPPLRLYPTTEQEKDIVTAYQQALDDGALAVIGPLTRDAIRAIAKRGDLPVPTLALNSLDDDSPRPAKLYSMGLSIEAESRQIARRMYEGGARNPALLVSAAPLAEKMGRAFANEWQKLAGSAPQPLAIDKTALKDLKAALQALESDAVFMAADVRRARQIRPYLGNERPVYATSQVWNGKFGKTAANIDLLGVRFVDMPWLTAPTSPEVQRYPRSGKPLSADLERLYALGIDAWRLSGLLLTQGGAAVTLNGVTGQLTLDADQHFQRELSYGEVGQEAPSADLLPPAAPAATASPASKP